MYQSRLGLARTFIHTQRNGAKEEAANLYREVITMNPQVHSAYIELGEMLAPTDPMAAVDVYTQFTGAAAGSYDDAYIYGEIVRLLMKEKMVNDPRLKENMVMLGRVLGFSSLERYVGVLEKDFSNNRLLREVYAGVNGKPVDDPDLQQFFKFKCWKWGGGMSFRVFSLGCVFVSVWVFVLSFTVCDRVQKSAVVVWIPTHDIRSWNF